MPLELLQHETYSSNTNPPTPGSESYTDTTRHDYATTHAGGMQLPISTYPTTWVHMKTILCTAAIGLHSHYRSLPTRVPDITILQAPNFFAIYRRSKEEFEEVRFFARGTDSLEDVIEKKKILGWNTAFYNIYWSSASATSR
ncbi:hypothetical protein C8R47DRAFT_1206035 [Mycena vitilis]|nr:hypothetical protein C8R47DRAFT_1206035 [Mycena vitilis]